MKESAYNRIITHKGRRFAFNAMTCALAEVDDEFIDALAQVRDGQSVRGETLERDMARGGFIVDDAFDELRHLRLKSWQSKFSTEALGLTVAPTLACNFDCPYCYECPRGGLMSAEVASALVDMIKAVAKRRRDVQITWYGGEPLLALSFIEQVSAQIIEACELEGVGYSAYMVTNGYLISETVVDRLRACRVQGMQITIDGPREVHDRRRRLKGNGLGTFDAIIGNVGMLLSVGLTPDIRVNVDKATSSSVAQLLEFLKLQGMTSCRVSFGHVKAYTEACASIAGSCLDAADYARRTVNYQRILTKMGFEASDYPLYPGVKGNYCCADSAGGFVVDPTGALYKCWNDIGNSSRSVGSLLRPDSASAEQQMLLADYLLWSPFDSAGCRSCGILPICMGGCPYTGLDQGGEPECEKWRYNLDQVLRYAVEDDPTPSVWSRS